MSGPRCYLNGLILPLSEAKVGIMDLGLLRGYGIYEGITSFTGSPFHMEDHWKRFENSARVLGLQIPVSMDDASRAIKELVAHNAPGVRASIRMVLTGGEASEGIVHVPGRETFYITAEPASVLPPAWITDGAALITHEHARFLPDLKTVNYITAVILQQKRKDAGAAEILFLSNGSVLECATSNVFIVKDGILITPKDGILKGVTRKVVLGLADAAGITAEERAVSVDELAGADEIFITSSFKDIVPVSRIDGIARGGGSPGPITQRLIAAFASYTHAH